MEREVLEIMDLTILETTAVIQLLQDLQEILHQQAEEPEDTQERHQTQVMADQAAVVFTLEKV